MIVELVLSLSVLYFEAHARLSWDEYTDTRAEAIRLYYRGVADGTWLPLIESRPAVGGPNAVQTVLYVDTDVPCSAQQIRYLARAVDEDATPPLESADSNIVSQPWIFASGTTKADIAACAGLDICADLSGCQCPPYDDTLSLPGCPDGCCVTLLSPFAGISRGP